jgi:quercetin dioxygenase-like cupin family protein
VAIKQQTMTRRSFDSPDETRAAGSGKAEIINVDDMAMMRITLPPGWQWSKDVKPIANTSSCQAPHFQYVVSGRMHVRMDDGSEEDFGPGDLLVAPPGHDALVTSDDEPFVAIDITGAGVWAKQA